MIASSIFCFNIYFLDLPLAIFKGVIEEEIESKKRTSRSEAIGGKQRAINDRQNEGN